MMARRRPRRKPPKPAGSPVPNPTKTKDNKDVTIGNRVKQALVAGIMARYAAPAIAHIASLPSRLGVGFDGEEETIQPSSKRTTRSRHDLQLAIPAHLQGPSPTAPPIANKTPPPPPVVKKPIKAPPVASQIPPPPPVSQPSQLPASLGRKLGKAVKYGTIGAGIGSLVGPIGTIPGAAAGAGVGWLVGKGPEDKTESENLSKAVGTIGRGASGITKHLGRGATKLLGRGAEQLGRGAVELTRQGVEQLGEAGKSLAKSHGVKSIGRALAPHVKDFREGLAEDIKDIRNKFGFDNEELLSPSSRRTTNTLSPGRALMTSLRASNEQKAGAKDTANTKVLRDAAFEAVKHSDFATARRLARLEQRLESMDQPQAQAVEQPVVQVALPSQGRIEHGTRRNRADEGAVRASMDQMNDLAQGQTPQNPIGMDADEQLAMVPSPQRATPLPPSDGQKILKELRDRNALKERMKRAASFDGETMEGLEMANKVICKICKCCPCKCSDLIVPSSQRTTKVKKELHKDKVTRQPMEKVLQPFPAPDTHQIY